MLFKDKENVTWQRHQVIVCDCHILRYFNNNNDFVIIIIIIKTFCSWTKKTPSARAQSLYSLAKGLEAKMRDVAASISSQTGVSLDEATKETELSVGRLSDWAAYCDKIKGGNLVSRRLLCEEHKRPFPVEEAVPTSIWKFPLCHALSPCSAADATVRLWFVPA